MAEAPADPSAGDQLEQKILQALRKAGSPMRTPLLVRECQVPKQQLNRVLYQMLKESKVSLVAPATWSLGGGDPGALVPAQPAQPSIAQKHQQDSAATSEGPGPQLSGLQDSGRRNLSATVVYQQNPINMIYQSQVSIANSEATQIGHGNVIVKQEKNGAVSPRRPPPVVPEDSWGPQNIHMERSMLRRVQVGHGNKMELLGVPSGGPACSPSRGPPEGDPSAGFQGMPSRLRVPHAHGRHHTRAQCSPFSANRPGISPATHPPSNAVSPGSWVLAAFLPLRASTAHRSQGLFSRERQPLSVILHDPITVWLLDTFSISHPHCWPLWSPARQILLEAGTTKRLTHAPGGLPQHVCYSTGGTVWTEPGGTQGGREACIQRSSAPGG
ncbi:Z-DNA-binding protein 1 isoform X4 [Cavia porcellus]|uniref:Z-DNA-binding protein 1 isoform X4 n=1 Tax=Cavia porcellus TaxID=10141 RepID=UPI002FE39ACF